MQVSKHGITISYTDEDGLDHFSDCLLTHQCHQLSWPAGMTSQLADECWAELSWQYYNLYQYPSPQENSIVGIGFLLKEFWQVSPSLYSCTELYTCCTCTMYIVFACLRTCTCICSAYDVHVMLMCMRNRALLFVVLLFVVLFIQDG